MVIHTAEYQGKTIRFKSYPRNQFELNKEDFCNCLGDIPADLERINLEYIGMGLALPFAYENNTVFYNWLVNTFGGAGTKNYSNISSS